MAEEILVKEPLTKEMIEFGAEFMRRLDETGLDIRACLWRYLEELNKWRFVIADPSIRAKGAKRVYKIIQSVISKMPEDQPKVSLMDISALETEEPLIFGLKQLAKSKRDLSGKRVSREFVNGQFIEDAYIYRMN